MSTNDLEQFIKSHFSHVLTYTSKILSLNSFCYNKKKKLEMEALFSNLLEVRFTLYILNELPE